MRREVIIAGRTASLDVANRRLHFEQEGSSLERDFSCEQIQPGVYSVLIDGRSYRVVVGSFGELTVNGRPIPVEVFDPRELRSRKIAGAGAGRLEVAALMPGKVVRLLVGRGDTVEEGQGLVVVEAMKMQNEMKAPRSGRVIDVKTKTDATVSAGDVLLVIE